MTPIFAISLLSRRPRFASQVAPAAATQLAPPLRVETADSSNAKVRESMHQLESQAITAQGGQYTDENRAIVNRILDVAITAKRGAACIAYDSVGRIVGSGVIVHALKNFVPSAQPDDPFFRSTIASLTNSTCIFQMGAVSKAIQKPQYLSSIVSHLANEARSLGYRTMLLSTDEKTLANLKVSELGQTNHNMFVIYPPHSEEYKILKPMIYNHQAQDQMIAIDLRAIRPEDAISV